MFLRARHANMENTRPRAAHLIEILGTSSMKSQFFRVAVEGATSDGRTIERQHIQEMADAFDPAFRPARANLEHVDQPVPRQPV
ncbi:hypothetical protein SODG_001988 [Sodalis praecaptivus]